MGLIAGTYKGGAHDENNVLVQVDKKNTIDPSARERKQKRGDENVCIRMENQRRISIAIRGGL